MTVLDIVQIMFIVIVVAAGFGLILKVLREKK